jgi:hypothetical protein
MKFCLLIGVVVHGKLSQNLIDSGLCAVIYGFSQSGLASETLGLVSETLGLASETPQTQYDWCLRRF